MDGWSSIPHRLCHCLKEISGRVSIVAGQKRRERIALAKCAKECETEGKTERSKVDKVRVAEEEKGMEVAVLLVLQRPAQSLQNGVCFSKKLEHSGPAEQERVTSVAQNERLARTPELSLPKG